MDGRDTKKKCAENNDIGSKVLSGMFWKLSERICAQGISFIVSIILARILLPEEYGAVSLILVFIVIANVFVTSGLSSALIQKKNADETDFSTVFYCTVVMSIALYGILFFLSPYIAGFYHMPELAGYVRVLGIKILISAYNSIQHAYVSRHMIFKKFFFSTLAGTIFSGIVGIGMAYAGFGTWSLIVQYLSNSLIDTIILAFTIPWKPKKLFSGEAAKSLIGFGWKVLATDLFGTVFDNLRSLLIGRFYTSADLAFYNKGKQFPALIGNNIDVTLTAVLFPAMSNACDDPVRVKSMLRRSVKTSSYVLFPMMGGLIAIARPLVVLLLTEKWLECAIYLQLLCVSQAMSSLTRANLQAMKALGRSDVTLKLEFIKKPIYLGMLLVALHYGVFEIALSMVIYSFIATAMNMHPNKKLLNYGFWEQILDLLPATALSFVMFMITIQITKFDLPSIIVIVLQVVVGIAVYLAASVLFKIEAYFYLKERLIKYVKH